jgi:hypothetical protein
VLDPNHLLEGNTVVTMVTVCKDTRNTVLCFGQRLRRRERVVRQPKCCWFNPWLLLAMWSQGVSEQGAVPFLLPASWLLSVVRFRLPSVDPSAFVWVRLTLLKCFE